MNTSGYATTTEDEDYYYEPEYGYQDEAAAEPLNFEGNEGYGHRLGTRPEPKPVEDEDAFMIAAENFYTLKTNVPDAENRFLWGIAQDCVRDEDSATQRAEDLINTSDYPVSVESLTNGEPESESDSDYLTAERYSVLRAVFPDAATSWVWSTAKDHALTDESVFNRFVEHMQESGDYLKCNLEGLPASVKIEVKKMEFTRLAQQILHNIDAQHIEKELNSEMGMGYNEQGVSEIILNCMNNGQNYPSKSEEYYRQTTHEAMSQYSQDFDVEKFLQRFPNPVTYFEKPANPGGPKYRADVFKYLRSVVPQYDAEYIRKVQTREKSLLKCHRRFFGSNVPIKTVQYKLTDECPRFIHELTYVRFYEKIVESAAIYSSLFDTGCRSEEHPDADGETFDATPCELCDEVVPWTKVLQCTEAHMFCKDCVTSWVDDRLENAKVVVDCMQECQGTIPDSALRRILPEGALERLMKRRQDQEVGQARLDGIVNCMWCNFNYIPRYEDVVSNNFCVVALDKRRPW